MSVSDFSSASQWTTDNDDIIVDPRITKIIALKCVIVFITSIVGVVLALIINIFMDVHKVSPNILPNTRSDEVELDSEGHPMAGVFRNRNDPRLCLDTWDRPTSSSKDHRVVTLWPCHQFFTYNQNFAFTKNGELKQGKYCVELVDKIAEMAKCHGNFHEQFWVWLHGDLLYNPHVKMCLGMGGLNDLNEYQLLVAKRCNRTDDKQRWIYEASDIIKYWLDEDDNRGLEVDEHEDGDAISEEDEDAISEKEELTTERNARTLEMPSTTRKQPSTIQKQLLTTQEQPSTIEEQPSTTEEQPSTTEEEPSTTEEQPSTIGEQPSTTEEQPLTTEEQPSTIEEQPSTIEEQPDP